MMLKRLILGLPEDTENVTAFLHELGRLGISETVAAPGFEYS